MGPRVCIFNKQSFVSLLIWLSQQFGIFLFVTLLCQKTSVTRKVKRNRKKTSFTGIRIPGFNIFIPLKIA